jgi:hypothetical protein
MGAFEPLLRRIGWVISRPITAVSPSGRIVLSAHLAGSSPRPIDPAMGRRLREGAKFRQPK